MECALKALDINEGDEVIVPSKSYVSSASCVVNVNAKPIFADIDLNSQNISIQTIKKLINSKTKAIICVHRRLSVRYEKKISSCGVKNIELK